MLLQYICSKLNSKYGNVMQLILLKIQLSHLAQISVSNEEITDRGGYKINKGRICLYDVVQC